MLNYKDIPSQELFYPYEYKRQPLYLDISWEVRHSMRYTKLQRYSLQ